MAYEACSRIAGGGAGCSAHSPGPPLGGKYRTGRKWCKHLFAVGGYPALCISIHRRYKVFGPGYSHTPLGGHFRQHRTGAMQDPGYGLPRMPIPRTWVNKGKKKGRGYCSPALFSACCKTISPLTPPPRYPPDASGSCARRGFSGTPHSRSGGRRIPGPDGEPAGTSARKCSGRCRGTCRSGRRCTGP